MGLVADLGAGPTAVDTAVFIYFIEEHPRFCPLVEPVFREASEGVRTLVTSTLTLAELLVVPYRNGDLALAARYEALLTRSRGIHLVDITRGQLKAATHLRATTGAKTPDALQLVAAVTSNCRTLLTNDRRLPDVPGLTVLQLSDYAVAIS